MNNLGYSHIFKVVFSGPANVGKTCLCNRFFSNSFDEDTKSTIGVDFRAKDVVVDGKDVKLQIWDTAGQERFRGLSSLYYRGAHGIIFVFDISKNSSLVDVSKMMDELPSNTTETTAFLLLGNKSDLCDQREVMPEVAQELAQKHGCNYVEVSAKTGEYVNESIMSLITGKLEVSTFNEKKRELSAGTKNLPLTDVNVKCELRGLVASVVITQRYENTTENPLELTLGFPIDELGSVCKFEATKDTGEKIVGKVLPKKQAAEKYDDAIAEGKCAVLLEEKPGGIFVASVGMLGPKRHITVETTYITELLVIRGDVFQFTYKTVFDKQKRSEYINAANLQEVAPNYTIQVDVYAPSRIVNLKCTSHTIQTEMQEEKHAVVKADSGLSDANFVLRFSVQDPYTPSAWLEHNPVTETTAAMIPFLPDMEAGIDAEKTEFIFVADRSGSMSGLPWEACAAALQVFLRSIPPGCYFQIIGFGSDFETVFDESRQYTDTNLSFASSVVSSWSASLGGTQLLEPLKFVYSSAPPAQIVHRRVIVLTDGAVGNREAVVALVRKNQEKFETSCMGIGSSVDEKLVRDVAAAGGGSEEFSPNVGDLEAKVIRQLKRAMGREMKNIKVDWGELPVGNLASANDGTNLHVFKGEKLVLYAILEEKQPEKDKKYTITVTGTTSDKKENTYEITIDTANTTTGFYIHALAARNFIRAIVNSPKYFDKASREKLVDLSVKFSVSSPLASFVAVEETSSGEATEETMQKVDMVAKSEIAAPVLSNTKGMLHRAPSSMSVASAAPITLSQSQPVQMSQSQGACCAVSLFSSSSPSPAVTTTTTSTNTSPSQGFTASTRRRASSIAHKPPTMNKLTLANVVYLQRAEGQWALENNLAGILGSSVAEVQKGISLFPAEMSPSSVFSDKTLIDTLWATAIALAILETKYSKEQEKWSLLSTKAYFWMDKIFENSKAKIFSSEDWVGFAKRWLESI